VGIGVDSHSVVHLEVEDAIVVGVGCNSADAGNTGVDNEVGTEIVGGKVVLHGLSLQWELQIAVHEN
jgi:hypothetical protein